jgi:hypothetical protein
VRVFVCLCVCVCFSSLIETHKYKYTNTRTHAHTHTHTVNGYCQLFNSLAVVVRPHVQITPIRESFVVKEGARRLVQWVAFQSKREVRQGQ